MTYHKSVEIYGLLNSHRQKYWEMKLETFIRRKLEKKTSIYNYILAPKDIYY